MHSTPSSSGSSRSGSPDTRATSPASSFLANKSPESACLWVPSAGLTPAVLKALFAKHAYRTLDIIIADTPCPDSCDNAVLTIEWGTFEYATTPATDGNAYHRFLDSNTRSSSPYMRTAPCAAAHLRLFARAGLRAVSAICLVAADAYAYTLERPPVVFAPLADVYANSLLPASVPVSADAALDMNNSEDVSIAIQGNIPTLAEWDALWAAWDTVTTEMIPPALLHAKPIDLRHKCLFYIGHIPTFLDMLLSKAIGGAPTEPAWFWTIFERGIDPHVDDPDHCHNHSIVPTADADWPSLAAVLAFRDGVRARLRALYADLTSGTRPLTRNIARTLVMTHEHEAFHVETLLYMLIQRANGPSASGQGTLPPPGVSTPDWTLLAEEWARAPLPPQKTVRVPAGYIVLGHDDSEADDFIINKDSSQTETETKTEVPALPGHTYGWDNESPARRVPVRAFSAEWRCVTNAEYFAFWTERGRCADAFVRPSSPCSSSAAGSSESHTPEANQPPIPLPPSWLLAADGSVHIRTLFGPIPLSVGAHWPVLASHDGLAAYAAARGGRLPSEPELRRFLDLYAVGYDGGANTGMRSWHPVPGTMGLPAHAGKGCNGGVWEWTATVFAAHDGLVPTKLFTGYSADFFDGKHIIVLGGSYATLPRLERRTVRNFYQHNYPYPWIGARVVYDD